MANRTTSPSIIDTDLAEGSPPPREPGEHPGAHQQLPRLRQPSGSPAAQTGLIPALRIAAESIERNDAQDASRTAAETVQTPRAPQVPAGGISALIVEDALELAEMVQITLEQIAVRGIIVARGKDALARFNELQPDVVLLDIGLPDMTGWKVLDGIRAAVGTGRMPAVVMITAYSDASNRLAGKVQNVDSYLVKPFTPGEIIRAVQQALASRVG